MMHEETERWWKLSKSRSRMFVGLHTLERRAVAMGKLVVNTRSHGSMWTQFTQSRGRKHGLMKGIRTLPVNPQLAGTICLVMRSALLYRARADHR
jgi:hypothetical protein